MSHCRARLTLYGGGAAFLLQVAIGAFVALTEVPYVTELHLGVAGGTFFWSSVVQCRRRTREATMQTFFVSIAYLGVLLGAVVVETTLLLPSTASGSSGSKREAFRHHGNHNQVI